MISFIDELYDCAHDDRILLSLTIELNTICNEKCIHCYIPSHSKVGLPFEKITSIIEEFREMGGLNLTLTGGEIFLRKDIFEIIAFARNLNLRVFLLTNGTLITESDIIKLKSLYISELSISVYSLDAKIHDYITGTESSLSKTLDTIDLAIDMGISVTVKTPLMDINKYAYRELADYCSKRKINYVASCIIFSKSDGDSSVKKNSINKKDYGIIAKEIEQYEPVGRRNQYKEACGSLKYTLAVDASGNVYPCNSFYYRIGNVFDNTIEELWSSTELIKIQSIRKDELSECLNCYYKEKCYRCPGLAHLEDNSIYGCSSTAKCHVIART